MCLQWNTISIFSWERLVNGNSISDLYYSQFSDLFKFWPHADGPDVIYDKIANIRKIEKKIFSHKCE